MTFSQILNSPAKINLFLGVDAKCTNGYHAMSTYFRLLPQIADQITLTWHSQNASTTKSYEQAVKLFLERLEILGCEHIVGKEDNLIYKAVAKLLNHPLVNTENNQALQQRLDSLKLEVALNKFIPAQGGLGGGSSNAATVLSAVAKYLVPDLTTPDLILIAQEIGADCAIFILQHSALAYRFGDMFFTIKHLETYQFMEMLFKQVDKLEEVLRGQGIIFTSADSIAKAYIEQRVNPELVYAQNLVVILLDLVAAILKTQRFNPNIIPNQALDYLKLANMIAARYSLWSKGSFAVITSDFRINTKQAFASLEPTPPATDAWEYPYKFKTLFHQSCARMFNAEQMPKYLNSFAYEFFASQPALNELRDKFQGTLNLSGTGATCFVYIPEIPELTDWYVKTFTQHLAQNEQAQQAHLTMHLVNLQDLSRLVYS
ncbi:hypothetical protein [Psittacicella hinzii]|uniref:4-diphosphocytidyl-2-C-methyl-D-erythritol kinase n=1 Tax=Psittacicella hinzii TaxID=2028575 RepID=A0A3A1YBI1_9GAMM|nr:hypothetical protein [Psittacicella hinzii]RIY35035.1 hypothetical protein CKF58_07190 [Psittacicella hinzii]